MLKVCPCILILFFFSTCVHSFIIPIRNLYTFSDVGGSNYPMQRIVVDNSTGHVYVSARNTIYEFDQQFKIKGKISTGPELDHTNCFPPPMPCDQKRIVTDNDNKVLVIYRYGNQNPLLLSCGTLFQGRCQVWPLSNLNAIPTWIGSINDTTSYVASRGSTVAFVSEGPNPRPSLYSASTYDGRPLSFVPSSVASRLLLRNNSSYFFRYSHSSDSAHTAVKFRSLIEDNKFKRSYKVDYVYGFSYKGYSYFVTTQTIGLESTYMETRLARVCEKDLTFFSYMEVHLRCQRGVEVYNLATAAYKGPAGPELRRRLQLKSDDVLYVAFGETLTDHGRDLDTSRGSVVCSFPLDYVHESFDNATKDCFNAEPRTHILKHVIGFDLKCSKHDEARIDYCGSGFNHYIEGRLPIAGGVRTHVPDMVTSLAVTLQKNKTVAIMGTEEGDVLKVVLETREGKSQFRINIADKDDAQSKAIQSSNAFDNSHENVYFLTGKKVVKFPIASCSVYQNCHECLSKSSRDAISCGWCGTYCATFQECETPAQFHGVLCTPNIESVEPLRGPTEGGTLLTIVGDNFGSSISGAAFEEDDESPTSRVDVKVGGKSCDIVLWENEKIQCRTSAAGEELTGAVFVDVKDTTWTLGVFDISGNVTSVTNFTYAVPKLFGAWPGYGPISGGTNVTLFGENMDIGSSFSVNIVGVPCTVQRVSHDVSLCFTGPIPNDSSKTVGPFEVVIDNAVIKPESSHPEITKVFQYLPDPEVTSIQPHVSTVSGSMNLTISGKHLDSVARPRMIVVFTSLLTMEQYEIEQPCTVLDSSTMKCGTPSINNLELHTPTEKAPLISHMSFAMDGVLKLRNLPLVDRTLSQLLYYPDPEYESFGKVPAVVTFGDQMLTIEGKYVGLAHSSADIRVIIDGKKLCNITQISTHSLSCLVPDVFFESENLNQQYSVVVFAGTLYFNLGFLQTSSASGLGTVSIVVILLVLCIVLITIGFIIFYHRRRRKSKFPEFSISYIANGNDSSGTRRQATNDYHGLSRVSLPNRPCSATSLICQQRQAEEEAMQDVPLARFAIDSETVGLLRSHNLLIKRNHLTVGDIIGEGHFGCVRKGELFRSEKEEKLEVAIKTLRNSALEQDVEAFLQEGLMMMDFHHENVLTLIGVCIESQKSPMVIIPYMKHGDLLSYIRDPENSPTVKDLLTFGVEIASGMEYLSEIKFVHRDLAARNCMLAEDKTVKVADFGLSRDIYERQYYSSDNRKTKLPVKWMAPESLKKGNYTTKTDVWSYGIVLWELLTRGDTPYADVYNWQILDYIMSGRRMPKPSYCPDDVYMIMLKCWSPDPANRPTFVELESQMLDIIRTLLAAQEHQQIVGLDVTYVNFPNPYISGHQEPFEHQEQLPTVV